MVACCLVEPKEHSRLLNPTTKKISVAANATVATVEPIGHVEPIGGVTLANTNEPSREEAEILMALVDECDSELTRVSDFTAYCLNIL